MVIDIEVTNITNAEFNFLPSFKVSDQKGREYSTYSEKGSVFFPEIIISEPLKPEIKFSGKLYFQVPSDSEAITFIAPKAGTREVYKIVLN